MEVGLQTGANILNEKEIESEFNSCDCTINPILRGLYARGIREFFHYNTSTIRKKNDKKNISADGFFVAMKQIDKNNKIAFSYHSGTMDLDSLNFIFIRGDDVNKKTTEQVLLVDSLENMVLVNSGAATLATRDKFVIAERCKSYTNLIPQTICITNDNNLTEAWDTINTEYVVLKGRYGTSGKEVEKFKRDLNGLQSSKKHILDFGDCVAQEFLEEINEGDVRIMSFDKEILGGFRRLPGKKWLTNISNGGKIEPLPNIPKYLIEKAKLICEIYPEVRFQGMDLTYKSGKFIETNAFPASLGDLNILYGGNYQDKILDKLM